MPSTQDNLYKSSGVDVAKGDKLVQWLQKSSTGPIKNPHGSIDGGIGGFAGLFRPQFDGIRDPLLVSGTDGVGTKLLLALDEGHLEGIGIDLVAMCVNDLYCIGASPLFFLDYFATGKLNETQFKTVLQSIKAGLHSCQTFLLGGETAEMPGLYQNDHFDLSGFVVGVVSSEKQLGPSKVIEGDVVIGLESSGFHSNGYSLIRKLVNDNKIQDQETISYLLQPTRIYSEWPEVLNTVPDAVHAISNITGGGISGNLNRVIPDGLCARIDGSSIKVPQQMEAFLKNCNLTPHEVESVFNLGLGMMAVVAKEKAESVISRLNELSVPSNIVGHIESGKEKVVYTHTIGEKA